MSRSIWFVLVALLGSSLVRADWTGEKWNPFLFKSLTGFGTLQLSPNSFEGVPFLHTGAVDMLQAAGTEVFSVRRGVPSFPVVRPKVPELEGWTTAIQILSDDGLLTSFMHLEPSSIPASVLEAIKARRPIERGTLLGTLYRHKTLKSHVHFGVADCRRHLRINPQLRIDYPDHTPPIVSGLVVHRPGDGSLQDLGDRVSGDVELTLLSHDLIDGSPSRFPLHRLELELFDDSAIALFRSTVFDATTIPAKVPATDRTCKYFSDYDGDEAGLGYAIYRYPAWRNEKGFAFALTRQLADVPEFFRDWFRPFEGPWKTGRFPNGTYVIRVRAFDAKGNSTTFVRAIEIAN